MPKELVLRDVREEARREEEEEDRRRDRDRDREDGRTGGTVVDASSAFEEGLRWRNRTYEDNMPGTMPGMMVN